MKETKRRNLPYERTDTCKFGKRKWEGWTYHMKEKKTDELTTQKNQTKDIVPGEELRCTLTLFNIPI